MKSANSRYLVVLVLAIFSTILVSIGLNSQSRAVTSCTPAPGTVACPYIKTFGADVFAGGWFSSHCSANYQNYQSGSPPDANSGGILTYAKEAGTTPTGGSSSQYGAFALGSIEGSDSALQGFYGDGAIHTDRSQLSFANSGLPSGGAAWGGQFEGSGGSQGHCIPDYFTSKQTNVNNSALAGSSSLADLNTLGSANYFKDTSDSTFTISGGTIAAGKNIAIFVKGNVYISGDIGYAAHNATNVPKFALVVQGGSIFIGPGVRQITGWYIAQPASNDTVTTKDGVIWTCYDINTASNASSAAWLLANCGNKLTLNGAVVANHVNFRRINGDIGNANVSEDKLSAASSSNNISEIINYTPDMVLGGPFFNASSPYNLDSLVSLPPVF